jgi:hypothetical protein
VSETAAPASPRRRGTEKRQRARHVDVRCTDAELATIAAAAERAGLTVGAFMRQQAIGTPGPRAMRRPIVQRVELAQVLGLLGRVGGNVNQLARAFNTDASTPEAIELAAIKGDTMAMRNALMRALGHGDQGR